MTERSAAGRWLETWHERHPGATAQAIARACIEDGRSSYELLADTVLVGDADADVVLDVACGDGPLLETLAAPRAGGTHVGVDLTFAELAAGRARLGPSGLLVRGDAQQLPFPDASIDAVLCHFALMLLEPLDVVLGELRRVTRDRGLLAAVVPGGPSTPTSPVGQAFRALVHDLAERHEFTPPPFTDERTRSTDAMTGAIVEAGYEVRRVEPHVLDQSGSPEEVTAWFLLTYSPDFLDADGQRALERELPAVVASFADEAGTVHDSLGLDLIVATASLI